MIWWKDLWIQPVPRRTVELLGFTPVVVPPSISAQWPTCWQNEVLSCVLFESFPSLSRTQQIPSLCVENPWKWSRFPIGKKKRTLRSNFGISYQHQTNKKSIFYPNNEAAPTKIATSKQNQSLQRWSSPSYVELLLADASVEGRGFEMSSIGRWPEVSTKWP